MKVVFLAGFLALLGTLLGTRVAITFLVKKGYGQLIRDDGPTSHHVKRGTPTMGGLVIIAGTFATAAGPHAGGAGTGDVVQRLDAFGAGTLKTLIHLHGHVATALGVAGKVRSGHGAAETLERGADFVMVGRAAILHHDFPDQVRRDGAFVPVPTPVSPDHLAAEGLSPAFVEYMRNWRNFVADAS